MSEAKKALEQAIGKIGKAYGDLLRVAERHGSDITKEDYAKAQYFLTETIKKIWEKVDVVRDVAKATSGEFSLDSVEMPETEALKIYVGSGLNEYRVPKGLLQQAAPVVPAGPIDASTMDGRSLAQAIGGRLTKQAKAAIPRPPQSVNNDLDDGLGPPDTDDNDGADFIDE